MLLGFEFDFGIGWLADWRPRHATHARRVIKPVVLTREIITPSKTRVHVRTHIQRSLFIAQFRRGNYERSSRTNEDQSLGGRERAPGRISVRRTLTHICNIVGAV